MDPTWRGTTAGIKYLLPILFVLSLACWAVSISFYIDLLTWPLATGRTIRPSEVTLFFYTNATPLATTLAALADIILYRSHHLFPPISLTWSILAFAGWVYTLTLWGACEYSPDVGGGGMCPRFYAYDMYHGSGIYGTGRYYARLTLGALVAAGAVVMLGLAARAIDLRRRERRERRVGGKEEVDSG